MSLIERYIFKKAATATLIILGSLAGVVWIIQALKGVDIVNSNGQTIFAYLSLTSLAVPNLLVAIIPVALLLSTINTINALNTNTELVVVTASGCSNWTIAKPLIILALLCSLFAGIVGHTISPLSLIKLRAFVTEMRADLVSILIQEGTFNNIDDGLTFHISERKAGGILSGIMISDEREENTAIIYSAREGILTRSDKGSFLKLKDGEIQQINRKNNTVTFIKYQSYIFDLSSFSGGSEDKPSIIKAKERTTLELLNPDPDDYIYKNYPGRFSAQIHERFSEMLWPFAYVFMILAFAGQARSNRQSFSSSITAATISVIVARGLGFSAINSLKSDPNAIFLVYFLPLACIAFGGWFIFTNRPATLPKPMLDSIEKSNMFIAGKFADLQERYKLFRRRLAGVKT
jgi:lipopolysaccharide export system permease protein